MLFFLKPVNVNWVIRAQGPANVTRSLSKTSNVGFASSAVFQVECVATTSVPVQCKAGKEPLLARLQHTFWGPVTELLFSCD